MRLEDLSCEVEEFSEDDRIAELGSAIHEQVEATHPACASKVMVYKSRQLVIRQGGR